MNDEQQQKLDEEVTAAVLAMIRARSMAREALLRASLRRIEEGIRHEQECDQ